MDKDLNETNDEFREDNIEITSSSKINVDDGDDADDEVVSSDDEESSALIDTEDKVYNEDELDSTEIDYDGHNEEKHW